MPTAKGFNWGEFSLFKTRQSRYLFKFYQDNNKAFAGSTGDVARFKVWDTHGSVALDIDSVAGTTNGSICTIDNYGSTSTNTPCQVTVKFAQGDVGGLSVGTYFGEIAWVDDSQTSPNDPIEPAGRGKIKVHGSASGDVGKT